MEIVIGILAGLLVAAVVGIVVLLRSRAAALSQRDGLVADLEDARRRIDADRDALASLEKDLAVLRQRHEDDERRLAEFPRQLDSHFKALAGDALKGSTEEFLKLARQVFTAEQEKAGRSLEANKVAIEGMVKPVRESLDQYQRSLAEAEKAREKAFGSLAEQARVLGEDQRRLRDVTANLDRALRRPDIRGQWGEMQLKRLFELAGMAERVDYDLQSTVRGGEGEALRPDATVRLPNDRSIVIDVKTPLAAFLDYTETTDDDERARHLDRHAAQLKQKVKDLTGKQYWDACEGSPEFVVMYVPGESMLYAALQREPDLIDRAMEKNVIIATPTVLLALLKTVAMGWREKGLEENAERIAALGRELHDRLATVLDYVAKLGDRLDKTVASYNRVVSSIDTRLLPTARKLEDAEARSAKDLPASLEPIVEVPRELRAIGDGRSRARGEAAPAAGATEDGG